MALKGLSVRSFFLAKVTVFLILFADPIPAQAMEEGDVGRSPPPLPQLNSAQIKVIQNCSKTAGIDPSTPPHQLSREKRELMRSCIEKSGVAIPPPRPERR